ncbi:MAG: flagellar filament capping protein FliD [Treponema sp.]|nr:flagellar filament capping protein FliD [Treponema sp.]
MSDAYMPGVKSRFDTEKLIEDLMKIERIPRDRTEKNIDSLQERKLWWQDLGRRIGSMRDSSRLLFSFQNPFNERSSSSSDEFSISATASREALESNYNFLVKQLAQSDRFLSFPLDEKTNIEAGVYVFTVGSDEISLDFKGGTLKEFADALNRRGRDKINASFITVKPGSRSMLLEAKAAGSENRLGFLGAAEPLALQLGFVEPVSDPGTEISFEEGSVEKSPLIEGSLPDGMLSSNAPVINEGVIALPPLSSAAVPLQIDVGAGSSLILKIETLTDASSDYFNAISQPPSGPRVPSSGTASYGGITIQNAPSSTSLPEWEPPPVPQRRDSLSVFSLSFSDGSSVALPPITDTASFTERQYNLADFAEGKTITALLIDNANTHRGISVRQAVVFDPDSTGGGYKPVNAVSVAQDAVVQMEGIEMTRPSNTIDDIIPGVTVHLKGVSERPVRVEINTNREAVKNAIISFVGNYNRLMAELNVLIRNDASIIDDLAYLEKDEVEEMKKRLGAFSGDSSLNQLRTSMQRTVSTPYPTDADKGISMLAEIGIGTNTRQAGGSYNRAQLRGYLEIDEKVLDSALEGDLRIIRQLFGSDTSGDLIVDTGAAFNMDVLTRPFIDTGGIISLKTNTIDSRISQDTRRIETMDRQLEAKEAEMKIQYARMESAYARMEQMSNSLDNFSQRNNNNR